MKKSILTYMIASIMLLMLLNSSCKKEHIKVIPTVVIDKITDITAFSATCFGVISSDGGSPVIAMGICWSSNNPVPTITDNKTINTIDTKSFISSITGLYPGSSYYCRAYATNSIGIAYSSQFTLVTLTTAPTLTTNELSAITYNSVSCGGNITSDGGTMVTGRGICWSTNKNPTISDNFVSNGDGVGSFENSITDLMQNTTYYIRAYATNNKETGYGNEVIFKTLETGIGKVTDIDGNIYNTVTIGTQVWMVENLKTTKYNDGTSIPNNNILEIINTPSYWWYNNAFGNINTYGALYNWYAIITGNLCPKGWHIPSNEEWTILSTFLGKEDIVGGKLKEQGTIHWLNPNNGATNEVGFYAVPGGYRDNYGNFKLMYYECHYWSSTKVNIGSSVVWDRNISYNGTYLNSGSMPVSYGCSVRCIMD